MRKRKKLTPEHYLEKFNNQMNRFNYIRQPGEEIIQCKESYPPYWFISNKGYLFTAYYKDIKILEPQFDKTGKANKNGERAGQVWRYGTRINRKKNLDRFDMARMMLDHFGKCEFETDELIVAHHIDKRNNYQPNEAQKCNRVDNLQLLPESVHKQLTNFAAKTVEEQDAEGEEKARKAGIKSQEATQEQFLDLLRQRYKITDITDAVLYLQTINDDPSQIQARAYPIKCPIK